MDAIETEILRQTAERGPDKSICPSEVARALYHDWQSHMKLVRTAAIRLAKANQIEILRKGRPVPDLDSFRGVIRLRIVGPGRGDAGGS
jgi:glycerate-2-kinase